MSHPNPDRDEHVRNPQCPFCKWTDISTAYWNGGAWRVICQACNAEGPNALTEAAANEAWSNSANTAVSYIAVIETIETKCEEHRVPHDARIAILNAVYAIESAATRMRDRCVEKVKRKADSYQKDSERSDYLPNYRKKMALAASVLREVANDLQSLTLEEQENQ